MTKTATESSSLYRLSVTIENVGMMKAQIEKELKRRNVLGASITNIQKLGSTGLIIFNVDDRGYWAKLTPTGKIKRNSIRRDVF